MRRVLSFSATVFMMGIMVITGAESQECPEKIQEITTIEKEAAVEPLVIEVSESGVLERTHDVHLYTQEDADLIKRVALAEGECEGADGMWLIMSVIVNRLNDPDYPETVSGVIYQKNCFSSLRDGNFDKAAVTSETAEEAWQRIEAGDVAPQIIAFETVESNVLDQWFSEAFTYRHHKFYTKK